jgi:cytochrome P450
MTEFDTLEFFSDASLVIDPYKYYAEKRSQCPVQFDPRQGIMALTGYDEAVSIYRDTAAFSSCNAVIGPMVGLPFEPTGDDITDQIQAHRSEMPFSDFMSTLDPPVHTRVRGLLSKLMTPRRLKENEAFMWAQADRQLDEFLQAGLCEFNGRFAQPFSMLVIADLLGVPAEDHDAFRKNQAARHSGMAESQAVGHNPLQFLEERFTDYVESRRRDPRGDVLTSLAQAKYPDGSTPDVIDVVRLATFLFAAGQETTGKLLTFAMQTLGERPDLQQQLRDERSLIPSFLEESLRMEAPIKSHFRLTSKTTTIGDVSTKAGTTVMLLPGAFNRDPDHFENPDTFDMKRPDVREHLAFGRGIHTCPGAPLARVEGRVSLERILSRMDDIRISEAHHGPANERRYSYDPTFLMRGLTELHIEFTPACCPFASVPVDTVPGGYSGSATLVEMSEQVLV